MKDLVAIWCDWCFDRFGFSTAGWAIYLAVAVPLGIIELLVVIAVSNACFTQIANL